MTVLLVKHKNTSFSKYKRLPVRSLTDATGKKYQQTVDSMQDLTKIKKLTKWSWLRANSCQQTSNSQEMLMCPPAFVAPFSFTRFTLESFLTASRSFTCRKQKDLYMWVGGGGVGSPNDEKNVFPVRVR
jgi:hypothetical protein